MYVEGSPLNRNAARTELACSIKEVTNVTDSNDSNRYSALGAQPVINAAGSLTAWGGSNPSTDVLQAMEGGNVAFIEMRELLEKTGEHIARTLDVEAAYVTAGCYTALVLSTAACVTGKDPEKRDRIPDTSGMKNEILIQKKHRYSYDRAYTIPGTRLIEVGDEDGTTSDQLDQAITSSGSISVFHLTDTPRANLPGWVF